MREKIGFTQKYDSTNETFKSRIITSFFVDGRKDQGNLKLLEI